MSGAALETFLARLYTDRPFLTRFLADPQRAMDGAELSAEERHSLHHIDRTGLLLAAASFERKRTARGWRPGTRAAGPGQRAARLAGKIWRWIRRR